MRIKILLYSICFFPVFSLAQWESLGDDIIPNGHRTWSIKLAPDASIWAISTFDNFPPTGEIPVVHRSSDQGQTWIHTEIPEGISDYAYDITPIDSMTAYIAMLDAGIFKTTDGALTWNKLENYPHNPLVVHFFNENEGMVLGGDATNGWVVINVTTDGAETWTQLGGADWEQPAGTSIPTQDVTEGMAFFLFAVNSVYDYTESSILFGTSKGNIWMSNDKGFNWVRKSTPLASQNLVTSSVALVDSNTYMVVGEYNASTSSFASGKSFTTTDDGETWIEGNPPVTAAAIHHIPGTDSTFLLAGHGNFGNGNIGTAITYNMGANWQTIDFEQRILSMDFIDSNTGIAACCNLDIWSTANGQIFTWNFDLPTPTFEILQTEQVQIFPNPVGDRLYFKTENVFNSEDARVEIFSNDGRLIKQFKMYSPYQTFLSVDDLLPGLYILKFTDDRQILAQKFIKE